ncbi:MAG: hypothetical protein ACUZ8E_17810 [Candidatus Anammoxibacter sp.]
MPKETDKEIVTISNNLPVEDIEQTRAIAQVQASAVLARQYPRDEAKSRQKMLQMCKSPYLAEKAEYTYPRGGTTVNGPSIRLAEELARVWGNLDFGTVELKTDDKNNNSVMMSYCWDIENNVRSSITFSAKHKRFTKTRSYVVTDQRDVYEITQNLATRRLRKCILTQLPNHFIEEAVAMCRKTQINLLNGKDIKQQVKIMVAEFAKFDVQSKHIEERFKKKISELVAEDIVEMRSIYNTIKDSNGSPSDYFDIPKDIKTTANEAEAVLEKEKKNIKSKKTSKKPTSKPEEKQEVIDYPKWEPGFILAYGNEIPLKTTDNVDRAAYILLNYILDATDKETASGLLEENKDLLDFLEKSSLVIIAEGLRGAVKKEK